MGSTEASTLGKTRTSEEKRAGRAEVEGLLRQNSVPSHISKNAVMEQSQRKTMPFTKGGRGQPSDQFR